MLLLLALLRNNKTTKMKHNFVKTIYYLQIYRMAAINKITTAIIIRQIASRPHMIRSNC